MSKLRLSLRVPMAAIALTLGTLSAEATTILHLLLKADKPENTSAVVEKILHTNLQGCKPQTAVHLRFNEIVVVVECDPGEKNLNGAMATLGNLENVQSVAMFSALQQ